MIAWRDAQPDAAEIVLGLLSDHGHVTGRGKLSLAAELRHAGFRAGTGLAAEIDVVVAPAAAPGRWFRDAALAPPVAAWLAAQPWCRPLLARDAAILPEGAALPLALLGSGHARSADRVVTFAGSEAADEWGLPGHAPFDAPDVPEGGGMHGGLHRAELATVLVLQGGPIRRGAVAEAPCDLTDIAPTVLHLLGLSTEEMEGSGWPRPGRPPPTPRRRARGWTCRAASCWRRCARPAAGGSTRRRCGAGEGPPGRPGDPRRGRRWRRPGGFPAARRTGRMARRRPPSGGRARPESL